MNIYQSTRFNKLLNIPEINARTAHFFHKKSDGIYDMTYVDEQTMIEHDREKPVSNSHPIVLDIELQNSSYRHQLENILLAAKYYTSQYPDNKVGVYRHIPPMNFIQTTRYFRNTDSIEYKEKYFEKIDADNKIYGNLQNEISALTSFITIRGYMYHDNKFDEYLAFMTDYVSRAKKFNDPIYMYLTPHYIVNNKPVDNDIFEKILDFAENVWDIDSIIIWLDYRVPYDMALDSPWRNSLQRL